MVIRDDPTPGYNVLRVTSWTTVKQRKPFLGRKSNEEEWFPLRRRSAHQSWLFKVPEMLKGSMVVTCLLELEGLSARAEHS